MPRFQTYRYTEDKTTSSIYVPSTLLTADDVDIWAPLERTVLSYQGESGGSSVARNAKYTVKLSCAFTHTHLVLSFIYRHMSILTLALYVQPDWDK